MNGLQQLKRSVRPVKDSAAHGLPQARWSLFEIAFWYVSITVFLLPPDYLVSGSQVLIARPLVLSLDLVLDYVNIIPLGHTSFFGPGAYTAGLLAVYGWGESLVDLVAGAAVATPAGFYVNFFVVRGQGLTRLMVTLGTGLMLYEAANKMAFLTGGVDGLSGVVMHNLLGTFEFDLGGHTTYFYSLIVSFSVFVGLRRLVRSPFGLSLCGVQQGPKRMPAIGANVRMRLVAASTVSAAIAGVVGGLLAQTMQSVGLDSLGFSRSAELLIMFVLGDAGWLYGVLIGVVVFMIAQDVLASINPVYRQFWIDLLLMVIVLFARGDILGGLEAMVSAVRAWHARKGGAS